LTSDIQVFLTRATAAPVALPVRELLTIWGYRARTYESVARINRDLSTAGLRCEPDLNDAPSGSAVLVGAPAPAPVPEAEEGAEGDPVAGADEPLQLPPVALLVRDIPSATGGVTSVSPGDTLGKAQALMSAHDYSQLPVMSSDWELNGAVSWQSIAKASLINPNIELRHATMPLPAVVHADDDLLGQIDLIYRDDFVFVRESDGMISGIVTTADLTLRFRDLTAPFFELGEIERRMRRCINRTFTPDQLRAATGNRRLNSADDMVFNEYKKLLNNDARWREMGWTRYDCATFIQYLDEARQVRNRIMHFGEELSAADMAALTHCLNFMRALDARGQG
jgi:CBS domain-containing protein